MGSCRKESLACGLPSPRMLGRQQQQGQWSAAPSAAETRASVGPFAQPGVRAVPPASPPGLVGSPKHRRERLDVGESGGGSFELADLDQARPLPTSGCIINCQ